MINVNFHVTSNLNIPETIRKVDNDTFWKFASNEWRNLIEQFVPKETGNLRRLVRIRPKEIEYFAEYARPVYHGGRGGRAKFKYPGTSKEWDKAAIPTQEAKLIRALQSYVDTRL